MDVVGGLAMVGLQLLLLHSSRFPFGIEFLVTQFLGSFQGNVAAVGPVALQVRLPVGRARRGPVRRRFRRVLSGWLGTGNRHNDQESNAGGCQRTCVKSNAHLGSSLEGQLGLAEIISFWESKRYGGRCTGHGA